MLTSPGSGWDGAGYLSSPRDYHASRAVGSTQVKDYIDAEAAGDWTTYMGRYAAGPMLDKWRAEGGEIHPLWAKTAALVDATRFRGSRSTNLGSVVEALLWSPDDPKELKWAGVDLEDLRRARFLQLRRDDLKTAPTKARTLVRHLDLVDLIKANCPTVGKILAMGDQVERQAAEVATVRGVECRSRVDLAWWAGSIRAHLDFKVWTQWSQDPLHLIERWGAATQAAHYQLVSKVTRPGVEHASDLLVIRPGGHGVLPREYHHEFSHEEMDCATERVEHALDGMAALIPKENAA